MHSAINPSNTKQIRLLSGAILIGLYLLRPIFIELAITLLFGFGLAPLEMIGRAALAFVYSPIRWMLLFAGALQLYIALLKKHGPTTMRLEHPPSVVELLVKAGFALFLLLAPVSLANSMDPQAQLLLSVLFGAAAVALLSYWRRIVIDPTGRTLTTWRLLPRKLSYDAAQLGVTEIRSNGYTSGFGFKVFKRGDGAGDKQLPCATRQEAEQLIREVAAATGVPV